MDPRIRDANWSSSFANVYSEIEKANRAQALGSLDRKTGSARAQMELDLYRFYSGNSPSPEMLRRDFPSLPESAQMQYLNNSNFFSAKERESYLTFIAKGQTTSRDSALRLLFDVNPTAARTLILDRMRNGDFGADMTSLVILPDRTLPEMDEVLAAAYEQHKPVDLLIARYATERIAGRIRAAYANSPNCTSIVAYFFRVDPAFTAGLPSDQLNCAWDYARILMSPGLEDAAVRGLSDAEPSVRDSAANLLKYAISARPKTHLLDALKSFQRFPSNYSELEEQTYVNVLLASNGWIVTAKELREIEKSCMSENCRYAVKLARERFLKPIDITVESDGNPPLAWVGPYELSSLEVLKSKILQFPRGTRFRLDRTEQIWVTEQKPESIRAFLQKAGMKIVK